MTEDKKNVSAESAVSTEASASKSNGIALDSFYGVKAGMTRIFDEHGNHVPVTVIKLIPNVISQVKTKDADGYEAYQVAYSEKRAKLVNNCKHGHLKKAGITQSFDRFAEVVTENADKAHLGKHVSLDSFQPSTFIDVSGVSKGKGFQGVMKRYHFAGGPASHGSTTHRATGAIGCRATPARVMKNKKMPGHMGSKNLTVQNLKVVEVNEAKGYMLIHGSVPGAKNGFVRISKAIKK